MTVLWTAAGVVLVALALRDVFHTLWHPTGQGAIAARLVRAVWAGARRIRRRSWVELAGPLAMVLVLVTWASLVVAGSALVLLPHLDDGVSYSPGLDPGSRSDVVDALYLSLTSLSTVGYGDLVVTHGALRLLSPVEAVLGFGLLTAAVTWVLQVYPALGRRRALARQLHLLVDRGGDRAVSGGGGFAAVLLDRLAAQVVQARVDLTQYPETYYFHDRDERTSLPHALPAAWRLADAAGASDDPGTAFAGRVLAGALEDFAELVDRQFLQTGGTAHHTLDRYAQDHRHR